MKQRTRRGVAATTVVSWNTRRGSGQNSRSCSGRREVTAPDTAGHGRARRRCAHLVLGVRVGVVPQKFAAESSARRVRQQPQRAESRRRAGGLRRLDSSTSRTGRLPGSKTAPFFSKTAAPQGKADSRARCGLCAVAAECERCGAAIGTRLCCREGYRACRPGQCSSRCPRTRPSETSDPRRDQLAS